MELLRRLGLTLLISLPVVACGDDDTDDADVKVDVPGVEVQADSKSLVTAAGSAAPSPEE